MNILIKLMSIISLVIAPTLASIHGRDQIKAAYTQVNHKTEMTIAKADDVLTNNSDSKEATENLVNQLALDKIINKDDFSLAFQKGKLKINGAYASAEITDKYKSLLDPLEGMDFTMSNSSK